MDDAFRVLVNTVLLGLLLVCFGLAVYAIGKLCTRLLEDIRWRIRIRKWNARIRENRARHPDIVYLQKIGAIDEMDAIYRMIHVDREKIRGTIGYYPGIFDYKIIRSRIELGNAMRRAHTRKRDVERLRKRLKVLRAESQM